ncbi:MAG: hypothetical protein JOZ37_21075, partial [Actinobacteria bacterium]|nr:hypothetical protein [Actinomycetota bacterium]
MSVIEGVLRRWRPAPGAGPETAARGNVLGSLRRTVTRPVVLLPAVVIAAA